MNKFIDLREQKRDKKDILESVYGKIRTIDKKIKAFGDMIEKLKDTDPDNTNIGRFKRDIWDLQQDRIEQINLFRGYSNKDEKPKDMLAMSVADVIEYAGYLENHDLKKNKYKIMQLLTRIKCKGIDKYHDYLDSLREDLLKRCMEVD